MCRIDMNISARDESGIEDLLYAKGIQLEKTRRESSTSTSLFPSNINRIYHVLCPPALPALHKKRFKVSMNEKKKKNTTIQKPLPSPPLPSYAVLLMPVKLPPPPPPQVPGSISILTPPTHLPSSTTPQPPSSLFCRRHHLPRRNLYPPTATPTDLTPAGPIPCRKEIKKAKKIRHHSVHHPLAARPPFCAAAVVHVYHPADRRPPTFYPTQPHPAHPNEIVVVNRCC